MINVDVIFITYNQEQFVSQGIESILSQEVRDDIIVRIIVADDCSTDNTLSIIRSYQDKSPFEFIYTNFGRNVGFHENYRRAFALCEGSYIAILEGDDWWHSDTHIQQHVDFLFKHKSCSMSFNRIRFLNVYKETCDQIYIPEWGFPDNYYKITLKHQIICGNQLGNLSACVFRNSLIKKIPNEFYSFNFADWDLGMFMAQYGYIGYLKEPTSTYRIDKKGQWTHLSNEAMKQSMLDTLNVMDSLFKYRFHDWFEQGKYNIEHNINPIIYTSWKTKVKKFLHLI